MGVNDKVIINDKYSLYNGMIGKILEIFEVDGNQFSRIYITSIKKEVIVSIQNLINII